MSIQGNLRAPLDNSLVSSVIRLLLARLPGLAGPGLVWAGLGGLGSSWAGWAGLGWPDWAGLVCLAGGWSGLVGLAVGCWAGPGWPC